MNPSAAPTLPSESAPRRLRCPAPAWDAPGGADILGVAPGMPANAALQTVRCALGEDAVVTTEDRWLKTPQGQYIDSYGVTLGMQVFTVRQGRHRPCDYQREWQSCEGALKWDRVDDVVTVATPGVPGEEAAMVVWRTQTFPDGEMPATEALIGALIKKYGPPQLREDSRTRNGLAAGHIELRWVRDPAGRPLADPEPLFRACWRPVSGRGENVSVSWREGCGRNVWARLHLHGENPGLTRELNMGLVDQNALWAHAQATQRALQLAGQAQRDREAREAADTDVRL